MRGPNGVPSNDQVTYRYSSASLLSKCTFHWLVPLLRLGYSRPLELADLGYLPEVKTRSLLSLTRLHLDAIVYIGSPRLLLGEAWLWLPPLTCLLVQPGFKGVGWPLVMLHHGMTV